MLNDDDRARDRWFDVCHRDLGARPEPLLAAIRACPPARVRVAVLGAGIAGLVAAHELARCGARVTLFERSDRVGGRIFTHRFGGSPHFAELGAMRIASNHHCVRHYLSAMGLAHMLVRFPSCFHVEDGRRSLAGVEAPGRAVRAPGRRGKVADLADLVAERIDRVVRAASPGEIYEVFLARVKPRLAAELAREGHRECLNTYLDAPPWRLIQLLSRRERDLDPTFRLFLRDIGIEAGEDLLCLDGGFQQLPERLAGAVRSYLHLSHEVVSITAESASVRVGVRSVRSGRTESLVFDHVINTIPPPAQRLSVSTNFGELKRRAIETVRYASASKVALYCRERFWEASRSSRAGARYIGKTSKLAYFPDRPPRRRAGDGPEGVILGSYTIGRDSDEIARYDADELVALVQAEIGAHHPEILRPGMIKDHKVIHWQREAGFMGGCSVLWPSSYGWPDVAFLSSLGEALRAPEGRVHFAGEHCSSYRAWMEGAILSSLRCVGAIVKQAARPSAEPWLSQGPMLVDEGEDAFACSSSGSSAARSEVRAIAPHRR